MPAYPSTPLMHPASTIRPRRSVTVTDAEDGTIRGVQLYTSESYDIEIEHRTITKTQKDSLESFYASNKTAQIDITWDGSTYNCRFVQKPFATYLDKSTLWNVTCRLVGVKSGGG